MRVGMVLALIVVLGSSHLSARADPQRAMKALLQDGTVLTFPMGTNVSAIKKAAREEQDRRGLARIDAKIFEDPIFGPDEQIVPPAASANNAAPQEIQKCQFLKKRAELIGCLNREVEARSISSGYPHMDIVYTRSLNILRAAEKVDRKEMSEAEFNAVVNVEVAKASAEERRRNDQEALLRSQKTAADIAAMPQPTMAPPLPAPNPQPWVNLMQAGLGMMQQSAPPPIAPPAPAGHVTCWQSNRGNFASCW